MSTDALPTGYKVNPLNLDFNNPPTAIIVKKITEDQARYFSNLPNRLMRREYFKKERNKSLQGFTWEEINNDNRIKKAQPIRL